MKFIFSIFILLFALTSPVFAQSIKPDKPKLNEQGELMETYSPFTFSNNARLYWLLHVYSVDNDDMIDNYLKATECDLYSRFFLNEFEWRKVREATRTYLDKFKHTFPRRFEYIQPLSLDRYNFDLKGFPLEEGSVFYQSTRLEMSSYMENGDKCGNQSITKLKGYPPMAMLSIKQPFKLSFIRANEEMAKEYLKFLESKQIDQTRGRPAYIRFRVRIDSYLGEEFASQQIYGNFSGAIESIEVFADREMLFKLYEQPMY